MNQKSFTPVLDDAAVYVLAWSVWSILKVAVASLPTTVLNVGLISPHGRHTTACMSELKASGGRCMLDGSEDSWQWLR